MACAGGSVVSSEVAVGVKERLESLVDNVKIVRKQIKSNVIILITCSSNIQCVHIQYNSGIIQ